MEQTTNMFHPRILAVANFLLVQFALVPIRLLQIVLELPLHILLGPRQSFELGARRSDRMEFLESYTQFVNRGRFAVATFMGVMVLIVAQFMLAGYSIYELAKPTPAQAQTYTTTITTTWDRTGTEDYNYADLGLGCEQQSVTYSCYSEGTRLDTGFSEGSGGGTICPSTDSNYRSGMKFPLTAIPNGSTITNVELLVTVFATTSNTVNIGRGSTDNSNTLACSDMFNSFMATTYTTTSAWNTSGLKTIDLGATADSDVQTRLATTDAITISFGHTGADLGTIDSLETANQPQLRVTYTSAPTAPTGFASTGISTSTIGWGWTDTATEETRYDVHTAAHAAVAGCTNLAANSQSCTETGLSANTQYTRHAQVTDPIGTAESGTATNYTSIESPAGVSFSGITTTSITAASSTSLSNLTSGSSGVYLQENTTSTNSGWLTTNSWPKAGLTANTQYTFQAKARNGDSVETALSSSSNVYTLAASAAATGTRSTSTWYGTANFPFTNDAGWGSGGVQYYRYVWDQQTTHAFTGTESTWSSLNANCPGGTCTSAGATLTATSNSDGNDWYLHLQSYNGDDVASGSSLNLGPYYYDQTAPGAVATVNDGLASDESSTTSTASLSANWTAVTDSGSGLGHYQYAIGTTSGGVQVRDWTDASTSTSITVTGLTLSPGTTYYVSIRAIDVLGNTSGGTSSNGITVTASSPSTPTTPTTPSTPTSTIAPPTITNWQDGDLTADTTPTIAGAGPARGGVFIVVDRKLVRTAAVNAQGLYSIDLRSPLSLGAHAIVVRAKDRQGNVSDETAPITLNVVTPSTATRVTERLVTDGQRPTIRFTLVAPANTTVAVYLDAHVVKRFVVDAVTTRHVTIVPATSLSYGRHTISFVTYDQQGIPSVPSGLTTFTKSTTSTQTNVQVTYRPATTYVVQAGDSLWTIAKHLLGNSQRWTEIQRLNITAHPSLTSTPSIIHVGWTLQIPAT